MIQQLPADWHAALDGRPSDAQLEAILARVEQDRSSGLTVYPPRERVFAALELTPVDAVRAVIVGQDPYHGPGEAHGLAFSVVPPIPRPPSLRNILGELAADLETTVPTEVSLEPWARNGVLLLNTALTVLEDKPGSHAAIGWQALTSRVLEVVAAKPEPVVFLLWGKHAQQVGASIDRDRHIVIPTTHPSPLSAWQGFTGSRPFSTANGRLAALGRPPIDWGLASD